MQPTCPAWPHSPLHYPSASTPPVPICLPEHLQLLSHTASLAALQLSFPPHIHLHPLALLLLPHTTSSLPYSCLSIFTHQHIHLHPHSLMLLPLGIKPGHNSLYTTKAFKVGDVITRFEAAVG